jgi:phosphoribosylcarboxyaminoimidazole (NCAIR) mutase
MQNVKTEVKGNTLTITVDLSKRCNASKSGKSVIVATTGGNARLPGHEALRIGVNVFELVGGVQ